MASSQEFNNNRDNNPSKLPVVDFGIYYLDLVECPLDSNHKLRRHRLPYHLLKCKKNFPDKVKCPFGHYCYLDKHEIANHLQICPHKPKRLQADGMYPEILQAEQARNQNLTYNYDVDNYTIDEPYWD